MTSFAAVELTAGNTAPARARRYVASCLRRLGRDELIPAAERGVARLTTAGPGAPPMTVQVFSDAVDGTVRITVSDHDASLPLAWVSALRVAAHLRARRLLGVLGRCGVDLDAHGKTFWFEPLASTDAARCPA